MTTYTPEDVYYYACDGDSDNLVRALKVRENRINWYIAGGGWNALQHAIEYEQYDCVDILINSGINLNSKSILKHAALDCAARNGHIECVALLLNRGADINSRDNEDRSALTEAARSGHIECVALLLSKGAIIDDDDIDSYEPYDPYYGEYETVIDCRPMILAEIEHRRKRAAFDAFLAHYIEYPPYINRIYSLCYPSGDLIVAGLELNPSVTSSTSMRYSTT